MIIRSMTLEDLPQLPLLHEEGNSSAEQKERARVALCQLYRKLYFESPWHRPDVVNSLVAENEQGRIVGMIGAVTRPFRVQGRSLTAAVCSELYVAPEERGKMVGIGLMRQFLRGAQDLSVADIANDASRAIWERLGGFTAPLYDVNWFLPFRLVSAAASQWARTPFRRQVCRALQPLLEAGDWLTRRLAGRAARSKSGNVMRLGVGGRKLQLERLTPELFADEFSRLTERHVLRPEYGRNEARWLWARLNFLCRGAGNSRQMVVRDSRGRVLGWFIYQVEPGQVARVAQVVSAEGEEHWVLEQLFTDAEQQGAVGVAGRMQPELFRAVLDLGCWLRARKRFTLVHSRDESLVAAFQSGEAFLSLLEGEACLNIWNQPEQALDELTQWDKTEQPTTESPGFIGCQQPTSELTAASNQPEVLVSANGGTCTSK